MEGLPTVEACEIFRFSLSLCVEFMVVFRATLASWLRLVPVRHAGGFRRKTLFVDAGIGIPRQMHVSWPGSWRATSIPAVGITFCSRVLYVQLLLVRKKVAETQRSSPTRAPNPKVNPILNPTSGPQCARK